MRKSTFVRMFALFCKGRCKSIPLFSQRRASFVNAHRRSGKNKSVTPYSTARIKQTKSEFLNSMFAVFSNKQPNSMSTVARSDGKVRKTWRWLHAQLAVNRLISLKRRHKNERTIKHFPNNGEHLWAKTPHKCRILSCRSLKNPKLWRLRPIRTTAHEVSVLMRSITKPAL